MPSVDKIISTEQQLYVKAEEDFGKKVRGSEKKIFDEIMKYVSAVNITSGRLSSNEKTQNFLLSLENKIRAAFKDGGYNQAVKDLLTDFDKIAENKIKLHDALNKKRITMAMIEPVKRIEVQKTLDNLIGAGISKDIIYPVRQGLYRQILVGGKVEDLEQQIRDYVYSRKDKDSKLLQYSSQIAIDSINQFGGTIEGVLADEFGLNAFRYIGSIIKDSRAQCRFWVDKGILPKEELESEIETALDGEELNGRKCSGMIPGTNTTNFSIYRGGYRCRHQAIATFV